MQLKDKRVFIVEDNLANRAITQMLLERHGASTAIERTGAQAVSKLQEFAPVDVILLDLMLPDGVSGFDIYDAIRQMDAFKAVPVVVVSASDPAETMPQARRKGFAGFISKPIDFNHFPEQIARIIEGEHIWAEGG